MSRGLFPRLLPSGPVLGLGCLAGAAAAPFLLIVLALPALIVFLWGRAEDRRAEARTGLR